MNKVYLIIGPIILLFFASCDKKEDSEISKVVDIKGKIQKGPFINGTSILISELNNKLDQTGRTFTTSITNDKGVYEVNDISLKKYIEIIADGFYFNEITGSLSNSKIHLNAIFDTEDTILNVNVLTHLSKERIKYIVNNGAEFGDARSQAENEIVRIFNFDSYSINNFTDLDITEQGTGDAILIAISSIFQNQRTEADLTQLLADVINDIRIDGTLDNTDIQSKLVNSAKYLDINRVKTNLTNHYRQLGDSITIPKFEDYINYFVSNTSFVPSVYFPLEGKYGENILAMNDGYIFKASPAIQNGHIILGQTKYEYSFAAFVPSNITFKIKLTRLEGSDTWYYNTDQVEGWNITSYNHSNNTQEFNPVIFNEEIDVLLLFSKGSGKFKVEFFENNLDTASNLKIFSWQ